MDSDGQDIMQYTASGELHVELRYADITYEILQPAPNPIQIENEINEAEVALDPAGYLTIFDTLFPKYKYPNNGSLNVWTLLKASQTLTTPEGGIEMLLFPLVQQQGNPALAIQPMVTARWSKPRYRIVPGQNSVETFSLFTLVIIVWCLSLLGVSSYARVPEVSLFPELDILSKVSPEDKRLYDVVYTLVRKKPRDIAQVLNGVRVQVKEWENLLTQKTESIELGQIQSTFFAIISHSIGNRHGMRRQSRGSDINVPWSLIASREALGNTGSSSFNL